MDRSKAVEDLSGENRYRVIGPLAAFTIVSGSMLGVGIFLFPGAVAAHVNSIFWFFLVWIIGGVFAFSGSLACGELGAMFPKAGGDYVFQREAFGRSVAFAGGWVLFVTIFGGSIAGMSVAVFQYQVSTILGVDLMVAIHKTVPVSAAQLFAVGLIVLLTVINDAGTRIAATTQILFTLIPVLLLIVLATYAIFFGGFNVTISDILNSSAIDSNPTFTGIVAAFLFVNFAYSGWLNIIYVAGEVKNPARNIPRSMIWSSLSITFIYLLMCTAFLLTLGYEGLANLGNRDAGSAMAGVLQSSVVADIVLITITVAIVTSLNATVLTSSRVAYAMALDGVFWRGASKLGKNRVPSRALWIQALFASLLVVTGSFHAIIEMSSIAMFITGSLTVLALFVLRYKRPDADRPYRAGGYPWLPALYLLFSLIALFGAVREALIASHHEGLYSFLGVAILLLAYIAHRIYQNITGKNSN
ncbi:amino acid permease [Marinilabiliaceae bacterium ANBcel2]|nr:amino acid permease [Marinilabiliaceae bacterium ANBcel2]